MEFFLDFCIEAQWKKLPAKSIRLKVFDWKRSIKNIWSKAFNWKRLIESVWLKAFDWKHLIESVWLKAFDWKRLIKSVRSKAFHRKHSIVSIQSKRSSSIKSVWIQSILDVHTTSSFFHCAKEKIQEKIHCGYMGFCFSTPLDPKVPIRVICFFLFLDMVSLFYMWWDVSGYRQLQWD